MALTPTQTDPTDSFLREVDDDLRREQLQTLWQKHGRTLITGVSLLLIALGAYLFWQSHKRNQVNAMADRYMTAMQKLEEEQNSKARTELDALSRDGTPGYRAISQFDLAALAVRDNRIADARVAYARLAGDASLPKVFRDFATLRSVMLDFDTMKPAEAIAKLTPLAQETNPWFGTAGELVAVAHLKAGAPVQARPVFEALQRNDSVPPSIRARAQEMARMLGTPEAALKPIDGAQ